MTATIQLPRRWTQLRHHAAQTRLERSTARFDVIEAGRRSGKTERVKRMGVREAVRMGPHMLALGTKWYAKFCAPTIAQARAIFWDDLCDLSAPWWVKAPNITNGVIYLFGAELWVCGLDKPARIEGSPVDRLAVDELAEVKEGAWDRNLKPALDTDGRPAGRAWLFGVPRPGGQFRKLADLAKNPDEPDYAYHHWTSEEIVGPSKWASAKRSLDPILFAQEYEGKRAGSEGRAYYMFDEVENVRDVRYDPRLPLLFCFDFNRSPGVAVVAQEQAIAGLRVATCMFCGKAEPGVSGGSCVHCHNLMPLPTCTCVVGEVHIERGSNTTIVAARLVQDWAHHKGPVICYGDATGGAVKSSSVDGSDWDLLRAHLGRAFPQAVYDVPGVNPSPRARVNSVNLRACNADWERRLFVNASLAPNTKRDLAEQLVLKGGTGELDKDSDKTLGHASDGLGYCIHVLHPASYGEKESVEAY